MAGFAPPRRTVRAATAPRRVAPPAFVTSAVAAPVFAALAVAARDGSPLWFDAWLMEHIQRIDVPGFTLLLRPVDMVASSTVAVPLWFAVFVLFVASRWWLPAVTLIVMPIGSVFNQLMSDAIARPRPAAGDVVRVVGETDAYSFPSGHVAAAVLMYGVIFIVADRIANHAVRIAVKTASLAIIITIGPARIYYGAHWPSDVLAAYALCGAIIATTAVAYRRADAMRLEAAAVAGVGALAARLSGRLGGTVSVFNPRRLFVAVGAMSANGSRAADRYIREGIDTWEADGYITEAQAADLRRQADTPEVSSALAHLGAHIAMSVPLRFPLGSLARPLWTLSMRAKVEWNALRDRGSANSGRQEHTLLVATVSALPGFGAVAYMLSKPLRSRRAVAIIAFDRSMRRIPFKVYERLHLAPLMIWHAGVASSCAERLNFRASLRERFVRLRGQALLVGALIAANAVAIALFLGTGSGTVARAAMSAQLAIASIAGAAVWLTFWRHPSGSQQDAAGIMLWLIAGFTLAFAAIDSIVALHRRLETTSAEAMSFMPMTETVDDAIILAFVITALSVLVVFKDELLAPRASSVVMLAGVAVTCLAIGFDALGASAVIALEAPAQIAASGLLMLAQTVRLREVVHGARRISEESGAAPHEPSARAWEAVA